MAAAEDVPLTDVWGVTQSAANRLRRLAAGLDGGAGAGG